GRTYSYSPNGFFQINLPVYELALQEIQKHTNTDNVLDLYSGVGTIGLSVARGKRLVLVEVDKSAYKELERNCSIGQGDITSSERSLGSNITLPKPILAKSEDALDFIDSNQTVILDPPRAGCDVKLINKLLEAAPPKIIYLSCNPATQARDTKMLLDKYQIEDIKTFNFFPRTPHIENLVILSLK
ncbi:class I SAM-dependent RNA methyltransferase, partial [Candidatus Saccharibacteria bacterium]|nr:class I SAM-dependent RNA methyltransferase [Candidatus Saccharibacteria bacterium]